MANRRSQRAAFRRISTFAAVGVTATVTHYVAAMICAQAMHPLIANAIGYCLAVGISYGGHHRLTFRVQRSQAHHSWRLPRFILVTLGAVTLSELVLWAALEQTEWPLWLAQAAAIAVVPPFTYLLGRHWVFREAPGWSSRLARWMKRAG